MALYTVCSTMPKEILVKKSRFIGQAFHCVTHQSIIHTIQAQKHYYSDSTHVVYAWALGFENAQEYGMSDDGEPRGTAGKPILDYIITHKLTDIVITVVRYYGGIKLGTGGLVRAYSVASHLSIEDSERTEKLYYYHATCSMHYAQYEVLSNCMRAFTSYIVSEIFAERVTVTIACAFSDVISLTQVVQEQTNGQIHLLFVET